jgi:two-component system KDP operon response regulator KdpE
VAETILIVEDEPEFADLVELWMGRAGYRTLAARTGPEALRLFYEDHPDLVILDVSLPGLDGWQIITRIREFSRIPILMVTARSSEADKIRGLELGADDYITKPFSLRELLARVRAVLRRVAPAGAPLVEVGNLAIDLEKQELRVDGKPVHLTPLQFDLLRVFARNVGKLLTHRMLIREVWGPGYSGDANLLRVHVAQLRRKIESDPARPRHLLTEPGAGYRLVDPATR